MIWIVFAGVVAGVFVIGLLLALVARTPRSGGRFGDGSGPSDGTWGTDSGASSHDGGHCHAGDFGGGDCGGGDRGGGD